MKTVWVYPDKEVGDADHLQVFASEKAANRWFEDPPGVAYEYEVKDDPPA